MAIRLQPPLEHELRLTLLGRDHADDVFVQPLGDSFFLHLGNEAPLVLPVGKILNRIHVGAHCILPDTKPIVGTRFPRAILIVVLRKG